MYVGKILLMIILYATNARCSDRMLTRNARAFDFSSFFAWPQTLFSNRPNSIFSKLWPNQPQFQEWTKNGIASLLRLASFINNEESIQFEFRPEDGPRAAKAYQRRFGYRGQWLIKQLGNGFNLDIRLDRQPVPNTFSMPSLTPIRNG